MKKIIVLGAGMVGSAMVFDLASKHEVAVVDIDKDSLEKVKNRNDNVKIHQVDISEKKLLVKVIKPYDIVISAVPGFMGFNTLKYVIEAGKDVIDISFLPENVLELDELAKKNNVTAIVDCGVAPGMSNLIMGYYNEQIEILDFKCFVGGLPKIRTWPFEYKAPFSPIDVIEEYIRPARYVENGEIIVKPALSDVELIDFPNVGTLEAFNTDGLRSLIYTLPHIPNMIEKTMRYPGHTEKIKMLKRAGFFDEDLIMVKGKEISLLEMTQCILFRNWKLEDTEEEITVMRITIDGNDKNGKRKKIIYNLYDEFNKQTQVSSMARTTGYTATAAANMFLDGLFTEKGVFPPELVGKYPVCFEYILNYLKARDIIYRKEII